MAGESGSTFGMDLDMSGIEDFLQDQEAGTMDGDVMMESVCMMCGTTSQQADPIDSKKPIRFAKKTKDVYCHTVHLLIFGEMLWPAAWFTYLRSRFNSCS